MPASTSASGQSPRPTYHPGVPLRIHADISPRITRDSLGVAGLAFATIAIGTLIVAALEFATEIPDASAIYTSPS